MSESRGLPPKRRSSAGGIRNDPSDKIAARNLHGGCLLREWADYLRFKY
jgi:hypothetical protein